MDAARLTPAGGLTRSRLLRSAGAALAIVFFGPGRKAVALAAGRSAALALTPEQEVGPYYVGLERIRQNVALGLPGVPLVLKLRVLDAGTGKPVVGAACDIWQCDATGTYSDEADESTTGQTWLRGVQFTDAHGLARFQTIYPGHYAGRATHIHVKVHVGGKVKGVTYVGGHVSHTGQLFFDDAISTRVYALTPYTSDTNARVLDPADRVYTEQGGSKSVLKLTRLGSSLRDGFVGAITLAVDPAGTPAPVGTPGPGSTGFGTTTGSSGAGTGPPLITPGPPPGK